jgi:SAM-dependent methyltransferase
MGIKENYSKVFDKSYFKDRNNTDVKRQKSFELEKKFIHKYTNNGNLLDVGCSTGEFIKHLSWDGKCYGMEISEHAISVAKKNGIKFNKNIHNKDFFDVIIYRGTIQHIDTPFLYLQKSYEALKPGGKLIFLATPNANSIYFKLWKTLPFLDIPKTIFYVPSDKWLINALDNIGFNFLDIQYPYLQSPYSNVFKDHFNFILKLFGVNVKFPFWGNMVNLIVEKPID